MKTKRILAALLTAAMAATMLAGCNGDKDSSKTDSSASLAEGERLYPLNEEGFPDLGGQEFEIWCRAEEFTTKYEEGMGAKEIVKMWAEKTNSVIKFTHPPIGQEVDAFSIMMSSGDWPDLICLFYLYYPGGFEAAMRDGVALDTESYLETYAPYYMERFNSDELFRTLSVNDEGKNIGLGGKFNDAGLSGPDFWNKDPCMLGPVIRGDFLKEAGFETAPETIPEWYDMLTKFKENGVKIPYGWYSGGRDNTEFVATFSGAYDVYHEFMVKKDGTVTYGPAEPNFKEYLTEMNKWYQEGLINPDYPTSNFPDNIAPMLATGDVGAVTLHAWDGYSKYYDPVVVKGNAPEKDLVPAPFAKLTKDSEPSRFRMTTLGNNIGSIAITQTVDSPEACVALLDTLYKPDMQVPMAYGVEGKAYNVLPEGGYERFSSEDPDFQRYMGCNYLALVEFRNVADKPLYEGYGKNVITWKTSATYDGKLPNALTLTEEETDIVAKYRTSLESYADEWVMKFTTGAEPLTGYDKFVEGMKKLHLDDLVGVYQAAYDRYMARSAK